VVQSGLGRDSRHWVKLEQFATQVLTVPAQRTDEVPPRVRRVSGNLVVVGKLCVALWKR
jgi:hypothetical protein